ncbi:MAG TPA: DUF6263 family protein [Chitinophagaceae bacterium]|nr:DUF6263 family protein [Chitinophagaceae bacterium]
MYKLLSATLLLFVLHGEIMSQAPLTGNTLKFEQGQVLEISVDNKMTITQQAMGQAIDFTVNSTGTHTYTVTNATDDNTTLHHDVNKISFVFDGMGQKRTFSSDSEKDMKGMFGNSVQPYLEKKYDMIIDTAGNVLMSFPEKIEIKQADTRLAIVTNLLKETLDIVQPPLKGNGSFFKLLPGREVAVGDTWNESVNGGTLKSKNKYTISAITDTTIVVDIEGTSTSITKAEMMGNESTTTMNNKYTGKIIVDKLTRLIKEKQLTTEGTGTAETSFGSIPVTSKSSSSIIVRSVQEEK